MLNVGATVHYTLSVLDPDGSTACTLPRKRNLILDSGLDRVATALWRDLISYAVVGTGSTPVKRDSGATTFSRAGSTVTASAGFFVAGDVGRLLKFDTGAEMYITAYTSATQVTVGTSGTLAAAEGTVWYVNLTGLDAESKRTNTMGVNTGDNTTTVNVGNVVLKRTLIFGAEVGTVTYNEIGWSNTASAGTNLFGRDIITGGVVLGVGQQLKVVIELTVYVGPATSQAYASVVTGWGQGGVYALESMANMIRAIDNSGGSFFEPSTQKDISLSSDSSALSALTVTSLPVTGEILRLGMVANAYTTGSFTRTYTAIFSIAQGNSTAIRSMVFFTYDGGGRRNMRILLNAAETKDSDHTLRLTLRLTWGRVLTN